MFWISHIKTDQNEIRILVSPFVAKENEVAWVGTRFWQLRAEKAFDKIL